MPWLQVTFAAEVEDTKAFSDEFDEERILAAFPPVRVAYLVSIEDTPRSRKSIRAAWREFRRRTPKS